MDETIVSGEAGFRTRAELISEAIGNLLDELTFPEAPDVAVAQSAPSSDRVVPTAGLDLSEWELDDLRLRDLAGTALHTSALQIQTSESSSTSAPGPLLGLHNRDYPSLWALSRLAHYTEFEPITFDTFLQRVTRAAWFFASELGPLERDGAPRLTVMFPTNLAKTPSAERGFQSFAVGTAGGDNAPRLNGPFFVWGVATVSNDLKNIAVTDIGAQLLRDLDGLSLRLPHEPKFAVTFFSFLSANAPTDAWGFETLMAAVASNPDRQALMSRFAANHPEWSDSTVSSITQGYVSRAREWGLIEEKLVNGRYRATDMGTQIFPAEEMRGTK